MTWDVMEGGEQRRSADRCNQKIATLGFCEASADAREAGRIRHR